jgi:voltage-gated potassium channel
MGTLIYHYLEGWDYLDSLYFSLITLATIGYGDFSPQTAGGKMFTIFYIFLGVGIILAFINTLYYHFAKEQQKKQKWLFGLFCFPTVVLFFQKKMKRQITFRFFIFQKRID